MLRIRPEQMQAFERPVQNSLECRLYAHVKRTAPARCRQMGADSVREQIRLGIERAREYAIEADYDVMRYVDLSFLVGPDFDRDPSAPQPGEILRADGDPADRLDRLYELLQPPLDTPAEKRT